MLFTTNYQKKKLFFHQTKIKKRLPAFLSTTVFIQNEITLPNEE